MQTLERKRVVGNPGKAKAFGSPKYRRPSGGNAHRKPTKKNVGSIIGFTLGNPGKKGGKMATKSNKSHSHSGGKKKTTTYKSNPGKAVTRYAGGAMTKKKYKRNTGGAGSSLGGFVTNALFVVVGALGSKLGAQAILGSNNTGVVGYAGNAAVGAGLWFVADRMLKNRAAASGIIAGTLVQILLRAVNDFTPFGSYVAQLGMGDYQMQSFVTPQVLVDPWNSAEVAMPPGWAPRMFSPPAADTGSPMPAVVGAGGGAGGGTAGMGALYSSGGPGGWGGGLYAT